MNKEIEKQMYLDTALDAVEIAYYKIEKAIGALWSTESIKAEEWGELDRYIKRGLEFICLAESYLKKLKEVLYGCNNSNEDK